MTPLFTRRVHETGCTIEIESSESSLHAHVSLDDDTALGPGDRVRVHGEAVRLRFGEKMTLRRTATVERAGAVERAWTRLAARLDLTELYEVSFTPGRLP